MRSDFSVVCPYCGRKNEFVDDNWHDELIDDTEIHDIECLHCGKTMVVEVHAVYTLSAEASEDDD